MLPSGPTSITRRAIPFALQLLRCVAVQANQGTSSRHAHTCSASAMANTTLPAALEGLEPAGLWALFGQLSSIPRPSKHEDK
jgi:hypothetical protein